MTGRNVKNYFKNPGATRDNNLVLGDEEVTVTGNEVNLLDLSAQTEVIAAAGALATDKKVSKLELPGTGAVTLAAPSASMLGQVKIISMTEDNGDVTLALTNVQGGSAATTATFGDAGDELVLVAGVSKWNVASEGGVVLS